MGVIGHAALGALQCALMKQRGALSEGSCVLECPGTLARKVVCCSVCSATEQTCIHVHALCGKGMERPLDPASIFAPPSLICYTCFKYRAVKIAMSPHQCAIGTVILYFSVQGL